MAPRLQFSQCIHPNLSNRIASGLENRLDALMKRLPIEALSYVASTKDTAHIVEDENYTVSRVRWQVFDEVEGEGLLLEPTHNVPIIAQIVAPARRRLDTRDDSRG